MYSAYFFAKKTHFCRVPSYSSNCRSTYKILFCIAVCAIVDNFLVILRMLASDVFLRKKKRKRASKKTKSDDSSSESSDGSVVKKKKKGKQQKRRRIKANSDSSGKEEADEIEVSDEVGHLSDSDVCCVVFVVIVVMLLL